jgi:hypothetical protein
MIQDWKWENYGQEDCENVQVILESMTYDELAFESIAARIEAEEWEKTVDVMDSIENGQSRFDRV